MKRLLSLAVLALVAAVPLAAQGRPGLAEADDDDKPAVRGGFWLQVGAGGGQERLKFENDSRGWSDPIWAPSLNLRLGGSLGSHVRLGADLNGWFRPEGEYTETLGSIMPVIQLYPARTIGLHVRGGGGYAWSSVTDEFYDVTSTYGGFGTVVGAGWEVQVSRNVFLTPYVDWYNYWIQSAGFPDFQEQVLSIGLGITFQAR